ncbi:MAG: hypothetical protein KC550_07300, partial [Nanoarchaeota archaeon]|nr:hypothetical protein [Nanoarchaeota archaeon]
SAGLLKHQLMKIKYLNLNKYFKANLIFVSEELNGTLKKDVLFFRKIKDKVKYDPTNTQIYMVGDKPSQDIVSPIIAGYDKCFLLMNYHYEKEKNILNQIDRSKYITIKNISDIIGYFYDEL